MKRLFLSAITIMAIITGRAQQPADSTGFKSRKLKLEEINLVSSYYSQNGEHAAVTGGIGSQKLTDIANTIDVRLTRFDKKLRKHSFDAEVGIDHYTSASSDKIDLKANSSASHADTRIYPSLNWTVENIAKGNSFNTGLSVSTEFDYFSTGISGGFSKKTKDRNGEFSARAQVLLDRVKLIIPTELRGQNGSEEDNGTGAKRNTYTGSFSWSQIINPRLQVTLLTDVVQQSGYLSLPFYRVYFSDGSVKQEHLPDRRFKWPIGVRGSYFLGDNIIFRGYYRYYSDSWGLQSHTASIEVPVKINPFFSVSPFYRFYKQTGLKYFKPYGEHNLQDTYYTSNFDLSTFNSNFLGAGLRWTPVKGIFGIQRLSSAELRYGHYTKNIQMSANSLALHLTFK